MNLAAMRALKQRVEPTNLRAGAYLFTISGAVAADYITLEVDDAEDIDAFVPNHLGQPGAKTSAAVTFRAGRAVVTGWV